MPAPTADPSRDRASVDPAGGRQELELERFLPHRLSVLTNKVSRAIARAYAKQFAMTIPEWRVMAVLERFPGISAAQVAERTAMDKVRVSRAVAGLLRSGRLERVTDKSDRRRTILHLSRDGHRIYEKIAPLALDYERRLLARLTHPDRAVLDELLDRLMDQAENL